jgi:hypothetical protein
MMDKLVPTKVLDYLLERVKEEPDDPILAEALRGELIDMIRKLQNYLDLIMENRDALEETTD